MALLDMIESAAGSGALQQIGARVGLPPDQLQTAINALAPALGPKIAEQTQAGNLDGQIASAPIQTPGSAEAVDHGNDILGAIFGTKDVSRSVADNASAETGISSDKLKALLPLLASVATAVIATHQVKSAGATPSGQSEGGLLGALGGLLGGLGR